MIGYVTLGTNDLPRAVSFYDRLFETLDIPRFMEEPGKFVAWAPAPDRPSVAVSLPFDGKPATAGNGVMVALYVEGTEDVHRLHARALALGAANEGAPGPRGDKGFYAGYFRDLDGNKLNVFTVTK